MTIAKLTFLEKCIPLLLALVGMAISFYVSLPTDTLYLNAIATVGILMALSTGVSISVLLIAQSDIANELRQQGYYKILTVYARAAIFWSLLSAFIAIVGFFIANGYENLYKLFLFGSTFYAVGAFCRVLEALLRIGGTHCSQD